MTIEIINHCCTFISRPCLRSSAVAAAAAMSSNRKTPTSRTYQNDAATNDTDVIRPASAASASAPSGWTSMKTLTSKSKARAGRRGRDAKKHANGSDGIGGGGEASLAGEDPFGGMRSDDDLLEDEEEEDVRGPGTGDLEGAQGGEFVVYKVYKRRWFGLLQLVLLNIIVSWDWLSFSAVSTTASTYFNVNPSTVNWLSTAFLFSFVVAAPFTIYTLHKGGPRRAIIIASVLLLAGNWIRYGGTRANNFGAVMFGQILTGLAQPFVLSAPTRYSDLWFTGGGRVAATAIMSLANPLGGALGQLINPELATQPSEVPNMILYVAIISSVATIPSFFIPARPPTPCSASSGATKQDVLPSVNALMRLPEFWMIFIPYSVLVALFNSVSSLINQILEPYGFSETEAGIAGALLIVVGLVAAGVTSPLIDRSKKYLLAIKLAVPIISLSYLAFIWAPPTRQAAAPYTILSILGAASFSLVPIVLEYLCEITHPISPEITSTICWSGGQLLGGIFIVLSGPLTDGPEGGVGGSAPYNMQRVLWFQAVVAMAVVPLPLSLGLFGRAKFLRMRRVEADKAAARGEGTTINVL